jgi:hypothetical protein
MLLFNVPSTKYAHNALIKACILRTIRINDLLAIGPLSDRSTRTMAHVFGHGAPTATKSPLSGAVELLMGFQLSDEGERGVAK